MAKYLKINSEIPEFYGSFVPINSAPEGYMSVTDQQINDLQTAMDTNLDGSVVNGVWVEN